jgi:hypothetical protein
VQPTYNIALCISFPFVMTYEIVDVLQILVRHIVVPIAFAPTISNMTVDVRRLSHIISGCLCKFIIAVDLPQTISIMSKQFIHNRRVYLICLAGLVISKYCSSDYDGQVR